MAGLYRLSWAAWSFHWCSESQGWPQANGKLLHVSKKGTGSGKSGSGGLILVLDYIFHVDGKEYKGSRLHYSGNRVEARRANMLAEDLPYRRPFRVYYDPDNPARNCLEAGEARGTTYGAVLYGMGFLAAAVIVRKPKGRSKTIKPRRGDTT